MERQCRKYAWRRQLNNLKRSIRLNDTVTRTTRGKNDAHDYFKLMTAPAINQKVNPTISRTDPVHRLLRDTQYYFD
jgi:hypothetical protein